jgi:hypothetical protein
MAKDMKAEALDFVAFQVEGPLFGVKGNDAFGLTERVDRPSRSDILHVSSLPSRAS